LDEACDESNPDYESNCKEVCEPKFCCFSPDPEGACTFDNVIDTCNKYDVCEWIYLDLMEPSIADYDVNFEAPASPVVQTQTGIDGKETVDTSGTMVSTGNALSLDEACDESNPDYESNCKEVCEPKFCCFSPDPEGACTFDNVIDTCNKYDVCEWIYLDAMDASIADYDLNVEAPEEEDFNPDNYPPVSVLCSKEAFKEGDGFEHDSIAACREVCVDAECCNYREPVSSCSSPFCNHYAACKELKKWDVQLERMANALFLEEACDESNPDYEFNCKEVCEPKFCCFSENPEDICTFDNVKDTCKQYANCKRVYSGATEPFIADLDMNFEAPYTEVDVIDSKEFASVNTPLVMISKNFEAPPMEGQLNMEHETEFFDTSMFPPVSELCNRGVFEQEGYDDEDGTEACREVCVDAECCHTTDKYNCATITPLFCNHFAACKDLKQWDNEHDVMTQN